MLHSISATSGQPTSTNLDAIVSASSDSNFPEYTDNNVNLNDKPGVTQIESKNLKEIFSIESNEELLKWLARSHSEHRVELSSFSEEILNEVKFIVERAANKILKHMPEKWFKRAKSIVGLSYDSNELEKREQEKEKEENKEDEEDEADEAETIDAYKIADAVFKDADVSSREVAAQSYIVDGYFFSVGGSLIIAALLGRLASLVTTFQCLSAIFSSANWSSWFIGLVGAYNCFASILALFFSNTYVASMFMVATVSGLFLLGYDPSKFGFYEQWPEFPSIFSRDYNEDGEDRREIDEVAIRANLEAFSANIHDVFNRMPENSMALSPIEDDVVASTLIPLEKRDDGNLRKAYNLDLGAASCLSGVTSVTVGIEFESFRYMRFAFKLTPVDEEPEELNLFAMGFKDEMVFSLNMNIADLMTDFESRFSATKFYPFFIKKFTKITATMAKDVIYDTVRFKVHDTFRVTKYLKMTAEALNMFHDGLNVDYQHGKVIQLF